jgi:general secretion pathway protein L
VRSSPALAQSIIKGLQQPVSVRTGLNAVSAWWLRHAAIARDAVTPRYFKERLLAIDFVAEGDHFNVRDKDGAGIPATQIPRTDEDLRGFIKDVLGQDAALLRADRITGALRLLPSGLVRKRISLPTAVKGNLEEAVGYQIDVETPFRTSDVYYGARLVAETSTAIGVEIHVVLRSTIDALISEVDASGIFIERVYSCTSDRDPEPVLLLSRPTAPTTKARRQIILLCTIAASIFAAAVLSPLVNKAVDASRLAERAEIDMRLAAPIIAARRKLAAKEDSKQVIAKIAQRFPDPLQILVALTQSIPSDTWLTRLAMREGEIQISGLTPSTSILIDKLARTDLFSPPAYAAPAVLDPSFDRERFVLNIRVRPSL